MTTNYIAYRILTTVGMQYRLSYMGLSLDGTAGDPREAKRRRVQPGSYYSFVRILVHNFRETFSVYHQNRHLFHSTGIPVLILYLARRPTLVDGAMFTDKRGISFRTRGELDN